ncbi:twin-arginine translocation protein, TatB subunit [Oceaniovalibus guishaninsula JLT2003]|uniref:Sec-independent protein translocase protein TatB n=1 Tax=Oceaniovalibus guishaninsula JLT2003 TaxID=1231392 RepID=K2HQN6_9RHOB|nr:Sec-independent protein translocase protein TatB [Oceaniovalibus guishaninsula]EKE45089.1 twin-arginine translocation protein, TatB subunit [Oceaniovalibus guishaninsula JLT2003]
MFDIGMSELLVIGVVSLIVVGPKDLPGMFRTLGRFTGKMRGMAREFQRAMDDAADEAGVKDIQRDLKGLTSPKKLGLDRLNEAAERFEKWDPGLSKPVKPKHGPETAALAQSQSERRKSAQDFVDSLADEGARTGDAASYLAQTAEPAKPAGEKARTPLSGPVPSETET